MTCFGRIRIWRTRRHTPTKNSQEYPPPPPSNYSDLRKMSCKPLPSLCFKARLSGRPFMFFFHSNANKTHFYQRGFVFTLVLKVRVLELGNPKSPGVEFFETAPNISLESERKFRRPVYISSIQRLIISKLHSRLFQLLNSFLLALLLKYIFFAENYLICIKLFIISLSSWLSLSCLI